MTSPSFTRKQLRFTFGLADSTFADSGTNQLQVSGLRAIVHINSAGASTWTAWCRSTTGTVTATAVAGWKGPRSRRWPPAQARRLIAEISRLCFSAREWEASHQRSTVPQSQAMRWSRHRRSTRAATCSSATSACKRCTTATSCTSTAPVSKCRRHSLCVSRWACR